MTGATRAVTSAVARHRSLIARARDRGASTLEVVILAPGLLLIIGMAIVAMRIEVADQAVEAAAHDAARAASISRTQVAADQAARAAALHELGQQGLHCNPQVNPDTSQFALPIGQTAVVTVTVICDEKLSDIGMPGLPGHKRIIATFTSYLDQFRGRS